MAFASWHARLLQACQISATPAEGLLAGFSALRDRSTPAANLFAHWRNHVATAAQRAGNASETVQDEADILAAVLHDAAYYAQREKGRPKGKYKATPPAVRLLEGIGQWIDGRGGASAHVANLLGDLGATVCLVNLYHPQQLAQFMNRSANRLFGFDVRTGDPDLKPANTAEPGAPLRDSYVAYWKQGEVLGNVIEARITGRAIFRDPRWLGADAWTNVELVDTNGTPHPWNGANPPVSQGGEWPWHPGFVTWEVENTVLRLRFARCQELEKLMDRGYHYLLLSGIGVTGPLGKGPRKAQKAHKEQLRCLVDNGVQIHLEFSGEPDGPTIDPLKRELSGLVTMAGINLGEEIERYTKLDGCRFSRSKLGKRIAGAPDIYRAYRRALFLAKTLGLERLYVHGNKVDIVLRRNGRPGAMRAEIMANLFAKGMVVVALLQRSHPDDWERCVRGMSVEFPVDAFGSLFTLIDSMRRYDRLTEAEAQILAENGYLLPRDGRTYAVGVIPVFWPESSLEEVDTTGAGDMTSALSLLYAGP